jgi:flavin reductase (DIM6/NTAB) family NADH-FMN oxidoreductase RutF
MLAPKKLDQPPKYWDRLFAPSSRLATITTVNARGRVNTASYGTCTRVHHEPVFIAFTDNVAADNADNILAGSDVVVNLPRFDGERLEAASREFGDVWDMVADRARELIKKTPDQVLAVPNANEVAEMKKKVAPVVDDWLAATPDGRETLDQFTAALTAISAGKP